MVLPAKPLTKSTALSHGELSSEEACQATCHVEVEEGVGVSGNLLCFILFVAIGLVIAEIVTETVLRPKFLFLTVVAAGIGLAALQDAWLQRRPKFYRLVLVTGQVRRVILESPSWETIAAAERRLSASLGCKASA